MKKTTIRKVFASVLSILLVITLMFTNLQPVSVSAKTQNVGKLSPEKQQIASRLEKRMAVEEELYKWAQERKEEEKERPTKEKLEKMEAALNLANESAPFIINSIKDMADGGDFDTAEFVSGVADLASGILACIVPWGTVASVGLSLAKNLLMTFMGGEDGPSEMQLMEDRLNQRLDEIADQISEVQTQLTEMSDQINESTEKIIDSVSTEIEGQSDKDHLRDFMLSSGKDDFSYKQFRNYIYGTTSNNSDALTAYYALLQQAQLSGADSKTIKHYYDVLYDSLMDNRTSFHHYITGDGFGKSIVETYYDVLSKRPDLTEELDMSAEMATVQFAYDLYQTEMMMDQIILACNNYQYTQMVIEGVDEYKYGTEEKDKVLAKEILNDQKESVIAKSLKEAIDTLRMRFAQDLVYVMGITDTYTVEQNGKFYYHETTEINGTPAATVLSGQNIYLNRISATATELFDLDAEGFVYTSINGGILDDDGIVNVSRSNKNSTISLVYTDSSVSNYNVGSIKFTDGELADFAGGVGTEDTPYLISTADQFLNIADDMGAYYRLVKDIDFDDMEINSLGYSLNSVDSEVYEEFNGVVDGDGFSIANFNIEGASNSGVFAKIGSEGVVKNLTVSNVSVDVSIDEAKKTTTTFTGGILTGTNNGSINSCVVVDSDLTVKSETDNADAERTVYFKYGGVAGVNNSEIVAVQVKNTVLDVSSTHEFGGASTSANKNYVFVGGVCGTCPGILDYASVDKYVMVRAYTKSILSPKTTVNPYLKAIAAGITTNEGLDKDNISNICSLTSDSNVSAKCEIQVKSSGWGAHKKNRVQEKDKLITKLTDKELEERTVEESVVKEAFEEEQEPEVSIVDNTDVYPIGALELNQDKLDITVNSEKVENFHILNMYGFTTYNNDFENERIVEIIMLFSAVIDGKSTLLTGVFTIKVDKNKADSISVINYKDVYLKGEAVETVAMVEVLDVNGKKTTVTNANITIKNAETATAEVGKKTIEVGYQGVSCTVEIEVLCDVHYRNFDYNNANHFTFVQSVLATCEHGGYDEYLCVGCNSSITTNRVGAVEHNRVRAVSKEATCAAAGVIGKIYCTYCNTIFEEQVEIPKLAHKIVSEGDSDNHYCTECQNTYAHEYVVSESVVEGKVNYIYTCSTCGYVGQKSDANIITKEERLRPAVVVSDGFALKGGDKVKVYVDIENNPGVNGANFGIRYDERLELVEFYEGEFFANTATAASHPVNCGYNYVWGNESTRTEKGGNLLELVFRLPEDAKKEDTYEVSVVYSVVAGSEGGFSLSNDAAIALGVPANVPEKFKTKDGIIRIVDRLPGDIDNNNVVNLLDALYLSNCLVNDKQYPITQEIKQYGDVNLDGKVTVNDVVKILQSTSGGYGASLLSHEYRIHLNTNGYDYQPTALDVCLYGANNTYAALEYIEQEMKQREGYKFMGWYTRLEGGEKIDAENYSTKLVAYDQNQVVQTLYAHWQKNSVSFDVDGAISGEIEKVTFLGNGEQYITLPEPKDEYAVTFRDPDPANINSLKEEKMSRKFVNWLGSDGNVYEAGAQFPMHKINMGEITLTAQWDEWVLNFPAMEKTGYDATKITWYTDSNLSYKLDDLIFVFQKPDGSISTTKYENIYELIKALPSKTLYAVWTSPNTYYVKYDPNGGSGSMSNSAHKYGSDSGLSDNAYTNTYKVTLDYGWSGQANYTVEQIHKFQHWSLTKNGEAVKNNMASNWSAIENDVVTVYAVWDVLSINLTDPTEDRTGYTFKGWYSDANFTKLVVEAGKGTTAYETTGACTLYAKWEANTTTVTYNENIMGTNNLAAGNSTQCYTTPSWVDKSTDDLIIYEKSDVYLDLPKTDYYGFKGWFTSPSGGVQITDSTGKVINSTAILTKTVELFAHWTPSYSGTYVYDSASLKKITGTGNYHIVKDIEVSGDWTPIDTFSGTIDGHGHTIKNVKYAIRTSGTNSDTNFGFVRILTGTIKNVTFDAISIEIVKSKDGIHNNNVGGVAGYVNGGTIDNVHMTSPYVWSEHHRDAVSSGDYINSFAGAVAGFMSSGTIKNCSVSGSGSIWATAKKATKSADAQAYAGGVIGYMSGGTVSNCSRSDGVSVTSQSEVNSKTSASRSGAGGIIGVRGGGTYTGCTSTKNSVNAKSDNGSTANSSWNRSGAIVGSGA